MANLLMKVVICTAEPMEPHTIRFHRALAKFSSIHDGKIFLCCVTFPALMQTEVDTSSNP